MPVQNPFASTYPVDVDSSSPSASTAGGTKSGNGASGKEASAAVYTRLMGSGKFVHCSEEFARLIGCKAEQLYADPELWSHCVVGTDLFGDSGLLQSLVSNGCVSCEFKLKPAHGPLLDVRESALFSMIDGRMVVVGTVRLVANNVNEADTLLNEHVFKRAVDEAAKGVVIADTNGILVYANAEQARLFGYNSAQEMIGFSWRKLHAPESGRLMDTVAAIALKTKGRWLGHCVALRKNGTSFDSNLSLSLVPGGRVICVTGDSSGDIDEVRRLQTDDSLFRQLLYVLPTGVLVRARTGAYVFANEAVCRELGRGQDEIYGMAVLDGNEPAIFAEIRKLDEQVAISGERFDREFEVNWNGSHRDWHIVKIPVRDKGDAVSHIITLVENVTPQKTLGSALQASQNQHQKYLEMQREFISMVSHEFRTPLTAIQGAHYLFSRHAAKLPPDTAKIFDRLLKLQSQALTTMGELVDQVLFLNRMDQARSAKAAAPCPISSNITQLVAIFNDGTLPPRVQLVEQLPPGFSPIMDPGLLRAIVENLVSNAVKYSATASPVVVTLSPAEAGWELRVADRGRGIPKEDQARLFAPFYRASNVDTVPGTGLGLVIVKRAAEFCGGTVALESEPGVGTTVSVRFLVTPQSTPLHAD